MSYLAIEQLENNVTVAQKIKISKSMSLEALKLNMYKQGTLVDGVVTVEIYNDTLLLGVMSHPYSNFNTVGPNFHGMISFYNEEPIVIKKSPLISEIELTFKVTISGHTDSDSAFLGLVRTPNPVTDIYNEENNPNPPDPALDAWYLPFGLELYTN